MKQEPIVVDLDEKLSNTATTCFSYAKELAEEAKQIARYPDRTSEHIEKIIWLSKEIRYLSGDIEHTLQFMEDIS